MAYRCPDCGGLNQTKQCLLCRVRSAKRVSVEPPKPKPIPVIRGFPPKWCAYCGERLKRKKYASQWEGPNQFARRKFCGKECASKFQYQQLVSRGVIKS